MYFGDFTSFELIFTSLLFRIESIGDTFVAFFALLNAEKYTVIIPKIAEIIIPANEVASFKSIL